MGNRQNTTLIIGGGIVGCCTAYYLAKRGQRVILFEKGKIEDSASGNNAGIVALGHLPLPRPGLARQAVRWMFTDTSPLYIQPRLDLGLWSWLWHFYRSCNAAQVAHCMQVLGQLGHQTIRCWHELVGEESLATCFQRRGWLDVYRTETGRRHAAHDAEIAGGVGFSVKVLNRADLLALEPAFGNGVQGAVHYPESVFLDPGRFLTHLTHRLSALGVEIREETPIESPILKGGRCVGLVTTDGQKSWGSPVVLAAGIWSSDLARRWGIKLPLQAGKGYSLDLEPPEPRLRTASVLSEAYVAVTPMGDKLRLAGTVELSGINHHIVPCRLHMLQRGAADYLRGIEKANEINRGCALRPCTADGLPVVGWATQPEGLFLATGHAKMGLTHGPITGRLVSECLLDGQPSLDIASLQIQRF